MKRVLLTYPVELLFILFLLFWCTSWGYAQDMPRVIMHYPHPVVDMDGKRVESPFEKPTHWEIKSVPMDKANDFLKENIEWEPWTADTKTIDEHRWRILLRRKVQ